MGAQPRMDRQPMEKRRVLVVDDNEDAAELCGDLLRSVGHEVCCASSGDEALRALRSFDAEVAILDLNLSGTDGCALAGQIALARHGEGKPAPMLVALTGRGQAQDRARTREAGFARHLVKPVEAEELFASVRPEP